MPDIIYANIFPSNIIAGLATGYSNNDSPISYFKTQHFSDDKVSKSRRLFERTFSDKVTIFYYQRQIHSDIVTEINSLNFADKFESDAIITKEKGIMLNVSVADCQAVLVYDSKNHVIAAIHSGWKGTKSNIVGKTISKLIKEYSTKAKDLIIYLPPSASLANYEVGEEFLDYFPNSVIKINNRYYFDNRQEIKNLLLALGCLSINIESQNDCTIVNNRFHSYRRDKLKSGRMSAFIGVVEE